MLNGVQHFFLLIHSIEQAKKIPPTSKSILAHQGGVQLTPKEQQQVIAFLHTLTDSSFVENSASPPFIPH